MKYRSLIYGLSGLLSLSVPFASAETLLDIYQQALKNDHQLKADTAAYKAGLENVKLGRAALLPQLSGEATYSEGDTNTVGAVVTGGGSFPDSTTEDKTESYQVTLSQPLFNLPAWFGYQRGKALNAQAEAKFSADQQAFIVRISETYFNVLRAVDNLETSMAEEKALGHQLEQTKQRFEVGLTAITDVHEAQAAFDNSTAVSLEAKGNLGIAFESLGVLTGSIHEKIAPISERFPVVEPTPATRKDWVNFALKNNASLKVAQFASDAAKQQYRAKKSEHLPTLSAGATYTDNDTNSDFITNSTQNNDRRFENTTVRLQLSVPLYSGGSVSASRRQAYHQSTQSREEYYKATRDTIQSARTLHLQVVTNTAQVKARSQAITSSLSALEATQAGYNVGTRNLVDVLQAQQAVYQARRNYSEALFDYIINTLKLKEVAGILTPQDIRDLNKWLNASKPVTLAKYRNLLAYQDKAVK